MDRFYEAPPRYDGVGQKLRELKRQYRQLRLFSAGKSVLWRKLYAVGLGDMKNAVLYTGAIHAQEWLTASILLKFLEELCCEEEMFGVKLDEVFSQRGLILMPMCNPDGVEIALGGSKTAGHLAKQVKKIQLQSPQSWQANARGVDLNHNFDAGYDILKQMEIENGITGPAPRQYGGIMAHSEPETRALVNVCKSLAIRKVFAFHSQGEEIYYDYGENTPPGAKLLADALGASCGYRVCHPDGMASHGGFKDWFIQTTGQPGFTIEVGRGENPLPIDLLDSVYARIREMLFIGILI